LPEPEVIVDVICTECLAPRVKLTSPFAAVLFVRVDVAYAGAEYERIFPVVGLFDESVMTWMFAERYQLGLIA
jgi:hypothetical protein